MKKTKVLVIGGGPAGSSAAYFLANNGIDVVLLDKNKWPRDKVCGGGLTVNCLPVLERMNLMSQLEKNADFKFSRYVIYWPDGRKIEAPISQRVDGSNTKKVPYSFVVRRDYFDNLLLEKAKKTGAKIITEVAANDVKVDEKVIVTTKDEKQFEADVVIVADGSGGSITRLFQKNIHKGSAVAVRGYYSGVKGISDQLGCYLDNETGWGFGWIFPLGKDSANIGYGVDSAYMKKRNINVRKMFFKMLERPMIKERLVDAKLEGEVESFPLRIGYDKSIFRKGKVLFAGDSAKLIYPLSGEGIAYALQSGEIAANVITDAFQSGSLDAKKLSEYERLCRKAFSDFYYAKKMQKIMGRPKLQTFFFNNGVYDKKLGDKILSVLEHSSDARNFYNMATFLKSLYIGFKRKLKI